MYLVVCWGRVTGNMISTRHCFSRCNTRSVRVIKATAMLFVAAMLFLALHMNFSHEASQQNLHRAAPISSPTTISQSTVQIRNATRDFLPTSSTPMKDELIETESEFVDGFQRHEVIACSDTSEEFRTDSKRIALVNSQSGVPCPIRPPALAGRFVPSKKSSTYHELAAMFPDVQDGGHYTPRMCTPAEKTAIIIPYRNRCRHLYTLLPNLISMLMRQNVDFTIFVIEQTTPETFNKGILFNAGYLEALKVDNYDCFILHDVDMIPIDDRNMYRCNKTGPVHFSPGVNKFKYKLFYSGLFGGVVGFTREQFRLINGASNLYFGWGGEDDDLRNRAVHMKLPLLRKTLVHGLYDMVSHVEAGWNVNPHSKGAHSLYDMLNKALGVHAGWNVHPNSKGAHSLYDMVNHAPAEGAGWNVNPDRFKIYSTSRQRQHVDGINSLVYNVTWYRTSPLYTWVGVGYNKTVITNSIPEDLRIGPKADNTYLTGNFTIIS
ncbi:unnamed protein product [Lymnaea stagnalis]|uniref:Beta-1,4-galactosyltransferase n=1 Tax=Lymnaea stagnalis TaxID=6523 RepID=A0AAV2GYI9_LYMST